MSIATALGLDVYDPLQIIESRWASWVDAEPALADVPDPSELEEWLAKDRMRANPGHWQVANEVMLGLARLAAVDGGDDGDAALVLAWLLLPTAIRAAAWYRPAAPEDIDELVAGQLFLQVRTYPWQTRPGSVGAGIGRDLRRHIGQELGLITPRFQMVAVDPLILDTNPAEPVDPPAELTVIALMDEAEQNGVLSAGHRALLEELMEQGIASGATPARTRSLGGLASPALTSVVAARRRVSIRTIRRQVGDAVAAIVRMTAQWEVA